jgi:hypothetical protein
MKGACRPYYTNGERLAMCPREILTQADGSGDAISLRWPRPRAEHALGVLIRFVVTWALEVSMFLSRAPGETEKRNFVKRLQNYV